MKICIICSLKREEECKKTKSKLESMGFEVVTPFEFQNSSSLYEIQGQYLRVIESCDIVLIIPKYAGYSTKMEDRKWSDHTEFSMIVGESVSYEIAYARHIGKPVIFGMLPFIEEKEEKEDVCGNDEVLCQGSLFRQSVEAKGV